MPTLEMNSKSSLGRPGPFGHKPTISLASSDVDIAAQLTAGKDITVNLAESTRIRRKIDRHIMPLMCILYMMQFADKATLGQSAVLGLIPSTHISQDQFNWLSTIFYIFFLVFQYPQNLALQKFPVGKWMSINIFIWAISLMCHAAAKNFGGLLACRILLGICEGSITPGYMIVTSMFYTRQEQTLRTGYWFLMNGLGIILLGLIGYGTLHITTKFMPWQWLMIIFGLITLLISILFWLFFPDSPANARFLTPEERVIAAERIKVNQAGFENKHFKRAQFIECIKDPKTWLFFFYAAIGNVTNSLSSQRQLIVVDFGFTPLQTTLLGCVDGLVEIIVIFCSVTSAAYWRNGRVYTAVLAHTVGIIGSILVNVLPSGNKVVLLCMYWISLASLGPFVIVIAWVGAVTSGHTKRITTNAVFLIGYALGNAAGPQYWKKQYQPRNHIPWAITTACWFACAILLLVLRWYLARKNSSRDQEEHDPTYDDVYLSEKHDGDNVPIRKVDKAFLDLTDIQNRDFRYVL